MASNHSDDHDGEFEDEVFDENTLGDEDFDNEAFDESAYMDDFAEDEEFGDEEYGEDEEWDESYGDGADPSLYTAGKKKGLSFNTIVIIGAVVVGGGVMAMTVMNKSAEMRAGGGNFFQSMLNITGVMDRTLFGEKAEEDSGEQTAQTQSGQDGFLTNPSLLGDGLGDGTPPQPVPLSHDDTEVGALDEPLLPLPDDMYAGLPRGPEEGVPQAEDIDIAGTEAAPPVSAHDILQQAIANREQKKKVEEAPDAAVPDVAPVADMPETDIAAGQISLPEKAAPATPETQVPPQAQGEAAPSIPAPAAPSQFAQNIQPAPSAAPSVSEEALKANTKALETLSTQMERITGRMESFEKELGAERDARTHTMERMEKTITALQKDVGDLKKRPVAAAETAPAPRQQTQAEAPPAKTQPSAPPAAKKQPSPAPESASSGADKPAASSQSASSAKSSGASGAAASSQPRRQTTAASAAPARWELRAAQPGRAWVSRAGSRDMQGVEVGQTLPGIGRITAITYQNGRWTVVGAQGRIEQ